MSALTPEDRFAILELVAQYNYAADYGDAETWADAFATDGVFEGERQTADGVERTFLVKGREELKRLYNSLHEKWRSIRYRHWNNNHIMDSDGQTASHRCYFQFIRLTDNTATISATAVYKDKLRKINGRWKFENRKIIWDIPPSPDE